MALFAQFRLFIGPMALPTANAAHYDYSGLNYASTAALPADTTLSATLADGATSLTCTSAAALPSKGGVWVGPNGAGQGWEYVRYTGKSSNTLTGLLREPSGDREHNGVHSSGAVVRMWWPVSGDDGTLRLVEEYNETLTALTWYAEFSGVNVPRAAMRTHHLVVVQTRTSPSGSWAIQLVGVTESPRLRDDERRLGEWSVRIMSSAWLMARTLLSGIRVGDLDLAKYAIATGSDQELVDLTAQRYIGGLVEADPDVSAASAVDRDDNSAYMGERFLGTPNTPAANSDPTYGLAFKLRFTGIYINPPAGASTGTRWIEITCVGSLALAGLSLFSASGGGGMVQWAFGGGGTALNTGDKIILCEDEAIYTAAHPLSDHAYLKADYGFFAHITAAGGEMALRLDAVDQWWCIVRWGHGNGGLSAADSASPPTWSGSALTAPTAAQTMRYIWAPGGSPTQSVHYWQTGYVQTAGYSIATSPASWVRVDLPRLGLVLGRDISSSVPGSGGTLYIIDGADASTTGLPASGTLQIGDEQITYGSRNAYGVVVSARGANSTTAAAHVADDLIWIVDGGVKTEGHLIKSVGWRNFGLASYPKQYRIKVSKLSAPRNPDEAGYNADWTEVYSTSSNAASSYLHTLTPQRVASVLIQVETMTTDPARARISEIIAEADSALFPAGSYLPDSEAGEVAEQIVLNAGIPAGAITVVAGSSEITGITTAKEMAWKVLEDMGDYALLRITVQRDSKIHVEEDMLLWMDTGYTASHTWDRANAASVEVLQSTFQPVSQVVVPWRVPISDESGTAYYTAVPSEYGKVLRLQETILPSSGVAENYAKRLFFLKRFPNTLLLEAFDAQPAMRPGQVHALQWQFDPAQPIATRYFVVKSVEHNIENQCWGTVLNLLEIDRQSGI